MSNENLLSSQTLVDHYREFALKNNLSSVSFKLNINDSQILSPYVNIEKVRAAKEDFVNAIYPSKNFKAAIVNVPMLIVFEAD